MAAFAALTIVGALAAQATFLEVLGYTPRPWYFLSLLALLATAMSAVEDSLSCRTESGSNSRSIRVLALDGV